MNEIKLYFIIGVSNQRYIYKYILALDKSAAKTTFNEKYPDYIIDEIKIISPSKKLIKQYSDAINRMKRIR